jgi:hypothetical protein
MPNILETEPVEVVNSTNPTPTAPLSPEVSHQLDFAPEPLPAEQTEPATTEEIPTEPLMAEVPTSEMELNEPLSQVNQSPMGEPISPLVSESLATPLPETISLTATIPELTPPPVVPAPTIQTQPTQPVQSVQSAYSLPPLPEIT